MGGNQKGKPEWQGQSMIKDDTSETDICYYVSSNISQLQNSNKPTPHKPPNLHPAIIDTGTTGHFLQSTAPCKNVKAAIVPIQCHIPEPQWPRLILDNSTSHHADSRSMQQQLTCSRNSPTATLSFQLESFAIMDATHYFHDTK
jgi:hypothetical protein